MVGLKPAIWQVIESKYASLTTWTLLLKAAREAEIAVSTGPDATSVDGGGSIGRMSASSRRPSFGNSPPWMLVLSPGLLGCPSTHSSNKKTELCVTQTTCVLQ